LRHATRTNVQLAAQ